MSIDPTDTGSRIPDPFGPLPDDMDDDFRPEDWLADSPAVSADFVACTFDALKRDQAEIADEAARLDEVQFPRAFLDAYTTADVSADFVARTAERVADEHAERDGHWHKTLASLSVPEPSDDFVDRTLKVLDLPVPVGDGAHGQDPVLAMASLSSASPSSPSSAPRLRLVSGPLQTSLVATAAAALLALTGIFSGWFEAPRFETPIAYSLSPSPWASALARIEQTGPDGVALVQTDGLLFAAHHASLTGSGVAD